MLVDFDGVLRRWPSHTPLERQFGLPERAFAAAAFAPDLLQQAITGRITDAAWREAIVERLAVRHPDAQAKEAVRALSALVGELDPDVLRILESVRARMAVVLVTNATTRLADDLTALEIAGRFDAVVSSSAIGVAKPDRAFFDAALAAAGATAAQTLFVDDTAENVAAAGAAGIRSLRFVNAAGLVTFLRANGVSLDGE